LAAGHGPTSVPPEGNPAAHTGAYLKEVLGPSPPLLGDESLNPRRQLSLNGEAIAGIQGPLVGARPLKFIFAGLLAFGLAATGRNAACVPIGDSILHLITWRLEPSLNHITPRPPGYYCAWIGGVGGEERNLKNWY